MSENKKACKLLTYRLLILYISGPDGTRTRDLLRDRQAF